MHRRVSQKSYAIIKQSCLPGQPAGVARLGMAWAGRSSHLRPSVIRRCPHSRSLLRFDSQFFVSRSVDVNHGSALSPRIATFCPPLRSIMLLIGIYSPVGR